LAAALLEELTALLALT